MAKTEGPLLSVAAHGSIAKIVSYQSRKHYYHVHKKATPKNPRSTAQIADRLLFAAAVARWKTLSQEDQNIYNALSSQYGNIPGFNVYIKLTKASGKYTVKFGGAKFGENAKFGGP